VVLRVRARTTPPLACATPPPNLHQIPYALLASNPRDVGYESADLADFLATLKAAEIRRVIDIRQFPISRQIAPI